MYPVLRKRIYEENNYQTILNNETIIKNRENATNVAYQEQLDPNLNKNLKALAKEAPCSIDLDALKSRTITRDSIRIKLHNEHSPVKRLLIYGRREDILALNDWANLTNYYNFETPEGRDSSGNVVTIKREILEHISLQVNGNMAFEELDADNSRLYDIFKQGIGRGYAGLHQHSFGVRTTYDSESPLIAGTVNFSRINDP